MKKYKVVKLKINCNKTDLEKLHQVNKESADIWNCCINLNNKSFKNEGKLYSKNDFRKILKQYKTKYICAFNKDMVIDRVIKAYKAISVARKRGRTDELYPYKQKTFYPTEWNYVFMFFNYDKNEIKLTTARYIGDDNKPHNGRQIRLWFKTKIPQNIQTLNLIYKNGCFYAYISYLVEIEEIKPIHNNHASIDLGEIHSITSTDNNNNQIIITGRKIRAIKQFRNKKQAELISKMDKCKKGSKQRKKYKLAYHKMRSKCRRQLDYCIHKLTKLYVDWAVEKGISAVYIGDVEGIEQNVKSSSVVNQKLNQWEYGNIGHYLDYKLGLQGIKTYYVSEKYTSQICPCCGFKNKPKGRNYICDNCGSEYHRDIVGAWNILKQNTTYKLDLPNNKTKYLRIV